MALQELDSFVFKFKNLCKSGRNANLNIKYDSGKTEVHLSVELNDTPANEPLRPRARNGPAQQRRRERRAAAREVAAAAEAMSEKVGAVKVLTAEPEEIETVAEKVASREATLDGSNTLKKRQQKLERSKRLVMNSALMRTFILTLITALMKVL